jgi:amidase
MEHHFQPTRYHNTFGPHAPVFQVADGDILCTTTIDAHGGDERGAQVCEGPNPLTGPFSVASAALAVSIGRVWPNGVYGFNWTMPCSIPRPRCCAGCRRTGTWIPAPPTGRPVSIA